MVSKTAKGHHVVPAYLLGQFAPSEELSKRPRERLIWVYEKQKAQALRCVENECKENHYFSVTDEDGSVSTAYENVVNQKIELPFNHLLSIIESRFYSPSRADAGVVYRYVANMFNRSKQRREASKRHAREALAASVRLSRDPQRVKLLTAAYSLKFRHRLPLATIASVMASDQTSPEAIRLQQNALVEGLQPLDDQLLRILDGKPYGILRAPPERVFFLGDNAIITRTPTGGGFVVGDGFAKPNVHILMPISPQACLQVGLDGSFVRTPSSEEVDEINVDTMRLAHRKVYSNCDDQTIAEVMERVGSTLKYRRDVFIIPPVRDEDIFSLFLQTALGIDSANIDRDPVARLWSQIIL